MDDLADDYVLVSRAGVLAGTQHEPRFLEEISDYLDRLAPELWPLNRRIHDNPELGFHEFIAHRALTRFFQRREGWTVTPSAYGMETAWVAAYDGDEKGPVVSFNVEMDALDGIGHACGHNLIATASVAGALATAEIMTQHGIGGRVVVFGTPAEEGGGGKINLLKAGAYSDHEVDISLISHPGTVVDSSLVRTSAYTSFTVEYFGREAHAAANPWLGINALDAMITAYNSISVLRQQTMPGDIIQGCITNGGLRPNIIHAYTSGHWVVRAGSQTRVDELFEKVRACFEAGATATGAKLKVTVTGAYKNHVPNHLLAASYRAYFNALSPPTKIPDSEDVDEKNGTSSASTDQGNISHAMPSISAGFSITPGPEGQGPHNPEFARAAGTKAAFERALRVGKALAGTAVDVLTQEGLLSDIKDEWRRIEAR